MNETAEMVVMKLVSEVETMMNTKDFKENIIKEGVKASLLQNLNEQKITSTEYQSALEVIDRYKIN